MRFLVTLVVVGCGASAPRVDPAPPEDVETDVETVGREEPQLHAFLVDGDVVLGSDGVHTVVGPAGRCVTSSADSCAGWVAFLGDQAAVFAAPRREGPPAVDPAAPFIGGFEGAPLTFRIESPPGDALCPGSPTRVLFVQNDEVVGEASIPAPVVREVGEGVVGYIESGEGAFVLLAWGNRRRLVDLGGRAIVEGEVSSTLECECCDDPF
ncbi:MAG: hypothetical protein AAGE52_29880 [Myxococcota bacterium]